MYTISPVQLGAIIGVLIHHGLFIHGEWHVQAPYIFSFHLVGFGMIAMMKSGWQLIAGYLLALFASILIYRVFFHRLRHFPGPFWACATKLWHIWKARNSQNHFLLRDIQKDYGDFVRTGIYLCRLESFINSQCHRTKRNDSLPSRCFHRH